MWLRKKKRFVQNQIALQLTHESDRLWFRKLEKTLFKLREKKLFARKFFFPPFVKPNSKEEARDCETSFLQLVNVSDEKLRYAEIRPPPPSSNRQ